MQAAIVTSVGRNTHWKHEPIFNNIAVISNNIYSIFDDEHNICIGLDLSLISVC